MNRTTIARVLSTIVLAFAVVVVVCAIALVVSWIRPDAKPWPPGVAPTGASTTPASPIIDYDHRPWALTGTTGYFNFTDAEWQALTTRWPATTDGSVHLPQGPVMRADEQALTTITNQQPDSARSGRVWIFGR